MRSSEAEEAAGAMHKRKAGGGAVKFGQAKVKQADTRQQRCKVTQPAETSAGERRGCPAGVCGGARAVPCLRG